MKRLACTLALLAITACGYRAKPADTDVSYTLHANRSTTVVVHPPPPQPFVESNERVGPSNAQSLQLSGIDN